MALYDVKFKIMFDDVYSALTRKYPSLKVFFWCNNIYDVIELFVDNPKNYPDINLKVLSLFPAPPESKSPQALITKRAETNSSHCAACLVPNRH